MKAASVDLQEEIIEELSFDPTIAADDVAVSVQAGVATLRGSVPTLRQKWDIEDVVKRIRGVRGIANELVVDLPSTHERNDTDIALAIERRFESNAVIPDKVKFMVRDGLVTLNGTVDWYYQSREAENEALRVTGVRDVFNNISILPRVVVTRDQIERKIHSGFARAADLDANGIQVAVSGTAVTLTGEVRNWMEYDNAAAAAWRVPGVEHVDNLLTIAP